MSRSRIHPKSVLLAVLASTREELWSAAALVPAEERASRRVCGEWTLKDVIGHVADWEWCFLKGLRQLTTPDAPGIEEAEDIEAWNQAHAEARRQQTWKTVWDDVHAARQALLRCLDALSEADLGRALPMPWRPTATAYDWFCVLAEHDRDHAKDLRREVR